MVDQVQCTKLSGSKAEYAVFRFAAKCDVDSFIAKFDAIGFTKRPWKVSDKARGYLLSCPASLSIPILMTSFCGLPTFAVSFVSDGGATVSAADLLTLWNGATLTNTTPSAC
ncbi:MAG: hypothetical protein ACR2LX_12735 [Jatrophihabitans sp.]